MIPVIIEPGKAVHLFSSRLGPPVFKLPADCDFNRNTANSKPFLLILPGPPVCLADCTEHETPWLPSLIFMPERLESRHPLCSHAQLRSFDLVSHVLICLGFCALIDGIGPPVL